MTNFNRVFEVTDETQVSPGICDIIVINEKSFYGLFLRAMAGVKTAQIAIDMMGDLIGFYAGSEDRICACCDGDLILNQIPTTIAVIINAEDAKLYDPNKKKFAASFALCEKCSEEKVFDASMVKALAKVSPGAVKIDKASISEEAGHS